MGCRIRCMHIWPINENGNCRVGRVVNHRINILPTWPHNRVISVRHTSLSGLTPVCLCTVVKLSCSAHLPAQRLVVRCASAFAFATLNFFGAKSSVQWILNDFLVPGEIRRTYERFFVGPLYRQQGLRAFLCVDVSWFCASALRTVRAICCRDLRWRLRLFTRTEQMHAIFMRLCILDETIDAREFCPRSSVNRVHGRACLCCVVD